MSSQQRTPDHAADTSEDRGTMSQSFDFQSLQSSPGRCDSRWFNYNLHSQNIVDRVNEACDLINPVIESIRDTWPHAPRRDRPSSSELIQLSRKLRVLILGEIGEKALPRLKNIAYRTSRLSCQALECGALDISLSYLLVLSYYLWPRDGPGVLELPPTAMKLGFHRILGFIHGYIGYILSLYDQLHRPLKSVYQQIITDFLGAVRPISFSAQGGLDFGGFLLRQCDDPSYETARRLIVFLRGRPEYSCRSLGQVVEMLGIGVDEPPAPALMVVAQWAESLGQQSEAGVMRRWAGNDIFQAKEILEAADPIAQLDRLLEELSNEILRNPGGERCAEAAMNLTVIDGASSLPPVSLAASMITAPDSQTTYSPVAVCTQRDSQASPQTLPVPMLVPEGQEPPERYQLSYDIPPPLIPTINQLAQPGDARVPEFDEPSETLVASLSLGTRPFPVEQPSLATAESSKREALPLESRASEDVSEARNQGIACGYYQLLHRPPAMDASLPSSFTPAPLGSASPNPQPLGDRTWGSDAEDPSFRAAVESLGKGKEYDISAQGTLDGDQAALLESEANEEVHLGFSDLPVIWRTDPRRKFGFMLPTPLGRNLTVIQGADAEACVRELSAAADNWQPAESFLCLQELFARFEDIFQHYGITSCSPQCLALNVESGVSLTWIRSYLDCIMRQIDSFDLLTPDDIAPLDRVVLLVRALIPEGVYNSFIKNVRAALLNHLDGHARYRIMEPIFGPNGCCPSTYWAQSTGKQPGSLDLLQRQRRSPHARRVSAATDY